MTVIVDIGIMKFNAEHAKALIERSPLKRAAIASECGVKVGTLTHYLNGHTDPGRPVVMHLARILEVLESELWIDPANINKKAG